MKKIFDKQWLIVFLVFLSMSRINIIKAMEKDDKVESKMYTLAVALEQRKMQGYAQDIRLIMDALSEEESYELEKAAADVLEEALPRVQQLDLSKTSMMSKGLTSQAVTTLSKYELTELLLLNLTSCETLTSDDIKLIVEKSPKIQTLLLTDCKGVDSKVFEILATNCKQLNWLSIEGCSNISDLKKLKSFIQVRKTLTRLSCANTPFTKSKSALRALNKQLTIDAKPVNNHHRTKEEFDLLEEDDDDNDEVESSSYLSQTNKGWGAYFPSLDIDFLKRLAISNPLSKR